jgi:hypothetical protein
MGENLTRQFFYIFLQTFKGFIFAHYTSARRFKSHLTIAVMPQQHPTVFRNLYNAASFSITAPFQSPPVCGRRQQWSSRNSHHTEQ